MQIFKICSVTL